MKKIIFVRFALIMLILLNLTMIYFFSNESMEKTGQTSQSITRPIVGTVVPDFSEKTDEEQKDIILKVDAPLRKLAHMAEFGTLAAWILLLLRTWKFPLISCAGISVFSTFLFASADELHQHLAKAGRSGRFTDVLIDTCGAILACLLICGLICLQNHLRKRKKTKI